MENKTYIHIMTDTLKKKIIQLEKLLDLTARQEETMNDLVPNMDTFEQIINDKDECIQQINQLDDGFEKIYSRIQEELKEKRTELKGQIQTMQELIFQITDKSTKLQAVELRNKAKIEAYFTNKRNEVKSLKLSNRTASNYYKSMQSYQTGESFFLDKKK